MTPRVPQAPRARRAPRVPRVPRALAGLVPVLAAVLAPLLAGCACTPLLEVRNVPEIPDDAVIRDWDAADAAAWPELDRLLRTVDDGEHGHAAWSDAEADALWRHFGIDPEAPRKEAWVRHDGQVFRVRVREC